jgi:lipocalin
MNAKQRRKNRRTANKFKFLASRYEDMTSKQTTTVLEKMKRQGYNIQQLTQKEG